MLLRGEGWEVNHKRMYRIHREEGLNQRAKRPKRRVSVIHRVGRSHDPRIIGKREGEGLIEVRARHKKGHYVWIEATGRTFNDDIGILKGIIIIRDISKRKSFESKLKQSEEKYRHLFEKSPFMIVLINPKGEIIDFNQTSLKYLVGYSRDDLIKHLMPLIIFNWSCSH